MTTTTWLPVPTDSGFGIANLPYGVVEWPGHQRPRVAVPIGDAVLDLAGALERIDGDLAFLVRGPSLDHLLAEGPEAWAALRATLVHLLSDDRHRGVVEPALLPRDQVRPVLPFTVADYVDFYSSEQHATNIGRIFRPDSPPLPPNWKHLPIGYHGRAGTVAVSGTDVVRPSGQRRRPDGPDHGPSERLDIEAEVGFVVGVPVHARHPGAGRGLAAARLRRRCWSTTGARGTSRPGSTSRSGRSWASRSSPRCRPGWCRWPRWRTPSSSRRPRTRRRWTTCGRPGRGWRCSWRSGSTGTWCPGRRPPRLYWTAAQQLAHLTANGASLRTGDLYASGTVSGDERDQRGSLIELTWNGTEPVELPGGETRGFLADGDTVTISATAPGPAGTVIAFGDVTGTVAPAR